MHEILVLPAWDGNPISVSDWIDAFGKGGHDAVLERESAGVSWLVVAAIRLRGYAVMDGLSVEAIHFELDAEDPNSSRHAVEQAAAAVSWEVHEDAEDDENDD